MARMKSSVSILIIALFLIAASCACSSASDHSKKGGSVTFALTGDIGVLDPAFAYDFTTNPVVNQITEGLLKFDENSRLVPNLAESWENPDPKTYIYHLRKGILFQDGTPMTADDVVFSMQRIMDPKTASYLAWMYGSVDRIEKVDDATVKVTLKQPDAQWKYAVATTAGHVISKAYYELHKDNFGKPDGGLMGTGPYKFDSWKSGSEVLLTKNTSYWDQTGGPYLDKITFQILPEGATRVTGLKNGQVNMTIGLPKDMIPVVEKMKNIKLQMVDSFNDDYIAFNTQKEPFNDVNVRKAVMYAFDRQKVMDSIVKDSGSSAKNLSVGPALFVFAKDQWEAFYKKVPDYAYSLDKAREALSKTKVAKGFTAKIFIDSDTLRENVALSLQASLKPLGIDLQIEKLTEEQLTEKQFGGTRDYDIIMGSWGSDFPDPAGNLSPLFQSGNAGDGGGNVSNYKNPEVDALLDEQNRITDDEKRAGIMIKALTTITDDAPFMVVDHPKQILVTDRNLEGYNITPLWYWDCFAKNLKYN